MSGITVPKLFLHAARDDVIPQAHGRRLFEAAPPPKTFVDLRGGHADAFDLDSSRYFGSIAQIPRDITTAPPQPDLSEGTRDLDTERLQEITSESCTL